jgi:hypothetical protein
MNVALYARVSDPNEALERGYTEAGYAGSQRRFADVAASRFGKPDSITAWHISNKYLFAGDREHALEWLEKAYQERDPNMPYLGMPTFDSLRSDPRFLDLLRRMNLPLWCHDPESILHFFMRAPGASDRRPGLPQVAPAFGNSPLHGRRAGGFALQRRPGQN